MIKKKTYKPKKISSFIFRLFIPFSFGYFLAVIFRNINVILAPNMATDLNLSNSELGFLTSAFFLSFSLAQIPLGILLDRYDTKFLQATLLIIAASGATLIAEATDPLAMFWGRCLVGLGLSGALLSAYKIYQLNLVPAQQDNYSYKTLSFGIFGGILCAYPLEYLLSYLDWRQMIQLISYCLFLSGFLILIFSPRVTIVKRRIWKNPFRELWVDLVRGLKKVLSHPIFWKCAPFALITYGGSLAIQSLWLGIWLREVEGFSRTTTAQLITAFMIMMFVSAWLISAILARQTKWGWHGERILQWAMIFFLLFSFLSMLSIPGLSLIAWALFYACSTGCTLSFFLVSSVLPKRFKGRAMTCYNGLVYAGAFLIQWLMGFFVDLFVELGYSHISAMRLVFLFWVLLQALAFIILFGLRKTRSISFRIPIIR